MSRRGALALLVLAAVACQAHTGGRGTEAGRSRPPTPRPAYQPRPEGAAEAEIVAELQAYYRDFTARDWTAFASHFWPDASITTIWQPPGEQRPRVVITPISEFVARAPEGPGSKPLFEERMQSAKVRVNGGLAQAWAAYDARFGDPGDVREWSGIDAFTLLKHEGRWKIVALVFN